MWIKKYEYFIAKHGNRTKYRFTVHQERWNKMKQIASNFSQQNSKSMTNLSGHTLEQKTLNWLSIGLHFIELFLYAKKITVTTIKSHISTKTAKKSPPIKMTKNPTLQSFY